jgi:hypothetical protein
LENSALEDCEEEEVEETINDRKDELRIVNREQDTVAVADMITADNSMKKSRQGKLDKIEQSVIDQLSTTSIVERGRENTTVIVNNLPTDMTKLDGKPLGERETLVAKISDPNRKQDCKSPGRGG